MHNSQNPYGYAVYVNKLSFNFIEIYNCISQLLRSTFFLCLNILGLKYRNIKKAIKQLLKSIKTAESNIFVQNFLILDRQPVSYLCVFIELGFSYCKYNKTKYIFPNIIGKTLLYSFKNKFKTNSFRNIFLNYSNREVKKRMSLPNAMLKQVQHDSRSATTYSTLADFPFEGGKGNVYIETFVILNLFQNLIRETAEIAMPYDSQ